MLWLLLVNGEKGNGELRRHLKLSDRTHLRQHYVDPAIDAGLIERTIPDKPTSASVHGCSAPRELLFHRRRFPGAWERASAGGGPASGGEALTTSLPTRTPNPTATGGSLDYEPPTLCTMINRQTLLADLRRLVGALEIDLRQRVDEEPAVAATLQAEYDAARAAKRTGAALEEWRADLATQVAVGWV